MTRNRMVVFAVVIAAGCVYAYRYAPVTVTFSPYPNQSKPLSQQEALRVARSFLGSEFDDLKPAPRNHALVNSTFAFVVTSRVRRISRVTKKPSGDGVLVGTPFKARVTVDPVTGAVGRFDLDDGVNHGHFGRVMKAEYMIPEETALVIARKRAIASGIPANELKLVDSIAQPRHSVAPYSRYQFEFVRVLEVGRLGRVEMPSYIQVEIEGETGELAGFRQYAVPVHLRCAPPAISASKAKQIVAKMGMDDAVNPSASKVSLALVFEHGGKHDPIVLAWVVRYKTECSPKLVAAAVDAHTGKLPYEK